MGATPGEDGAEIVYVPSGEAVRMRPAGIAEVEAVQADGRWDAAY